MKKSEMIGYIARDTDDNEEFWDMFVFAEDAEDYTNIVRFIIDTAVSKGMLPPDRARCNPDLNHNDHSWEEEND